MRAAILIIAPEVLREVVGPLLDSGLTVDCSLASPLSGAAQAQVVLVVSGDPLPSECERAPIKVVEADFAVEIYGQQRLTRVAEFRLSDRSAAEFLPPAARAA